MVSCRILGAAPAMTLLIRRVVTAPLFRLVAVSSLKNPRG
jgi:hypothetical protein